VLKASRKEGHGKPTRTNWSKGENLKKTTVACEAWKNQTAPFVTGMAMWVFAKVVQIPEKTLDSAPEREQDLGERPRCAVPPRRRPRVVCVRRDLPSRPGARWSDVAGVQNLVQTFAPHLRACQVSNLAKNVRKRNSGGGGPLTEASPPNVVPREPRRVAFALGVAQLTLK